MRGKKLPMIPDEVSFAYPGFGLWRWFEERESRVYLMRLIAFPILVAFCAVATIGNAQVIRIGSPRSRPQAIVGDTLTVTATPSVVNFALVSKGVALGSNSVTITTSFSGISLISSFALYGYFTSATMAMSGSTPVAYIPTSAILGKVPTGTPTTFTAFTGTTPFGGAGAGLQLWTLGGIVSLGGSRTDVLSLEINLSSLPQQPAATYTGSLFLQAQAF